MMKKLAKVDWGRLEDEIRMVLKDSDFDPIDALRCIDETFARRTGRGRSMPVPLTAEEESRLENCYPRFFDWKDARVEKGGATILDPIDVTRDGVENALAAIEEEGDGFALSREWTVALLRDWLSRERSEAKRTATLRRNIRRKYDID